MYSSLKSFWDLSVGQSNILTDAAAAHWIYLFWNLELLTSNVSLDKLCILTISSLKTTDNALLGRLNKLAKLLQTMPCTC